MKFEIEWGCIEGLEDNLDIEPEWDYEPELNEYTCHSCDYGPCKQYDGGLKEEE